MHNKSNISNEIGKNDITSKKTTYYHFRTLARLWKIKIKNKKWLKARS